MSAYNEKQTRSKLNFFTFYWGKLIQQLGNRNLKICNNVSMEIMLVVDGVIRNAVIKMKQQNICNIYYTTRQKLLEECEQ